MISTKLWAIKLRYSYAKGEGAWPYLMFTTKQSALDFIEKHSIEGVPARIRLTLKEVV
jgi:hypothetical protein